MSHATLLVTIGVVLIAGLMLDAVGRRTKLPRVTLLVLFGMAVGPSGFGLLPAGADHWYELLTVVALVMVAFLLGGSLTRQVLASEGRHILGVSAGAVFFTALIVGLGLWLAGFDPVLCLVLAGVATATDPAATRDVVHRSHAQSRPFARMLLGVVAIDDAWGLIAFSMLLALAHALAGASALGAAEILTRELGGAVLIGLLVGLPAAYITGWLQPGEPTQAEAIAVVLLCGGIALLTGSSFLLTPMIAGVVIANLARHHTRPFHEIENIEWPFMVFFFVIAGASLQMSSLPAIGVLGVAYILLRTVGRIAGGWIGGRATRLKPTGRQWIGASLLPQAGVAIGMALVAAEAFPALADTILTTTIGTTIVFELIGPVVTQYALGRVGDGPTTAGGPDEGLADRP